MHNLSSQLGNWQQAIQEYESQDKAAALQKLNADLDACKRRQDKLEVEVQVSNYAVRSCCLLMTTLVLVS